MHHGGRADIKLPKLHVTRHPLFGAIPSWKCACLLLVTCLHYRNDVLAKSNPSLDTWHRLIGTLYPVLYGLFFRHQFLEDV